MVRADMGFYSLQFWKEEQGNRFRAASCLSLRSSGQSQEPFIRRLTIFWGCTLMARATVSL